MQKNRRRKNRLVVDQKYQLLFSLKITLISWIATVVVFGAILFFTRANYETLSELALNFAPQIVGELEHEFNFLSLLCCFGLLLIMTILFLSSLYMTQKISGPILNLKRKLESFENGENPVRIRFRKNDGLDELEEQFNRAMRKHEARHEQINRQLNRLSKELESHPQLSSAKEIARGLSELL